MPGFGWIIRNQSYVRVKETLIKKDSDFLLAQTKKIFGGALKIYPCMIFIIHLTENIFTITYNYKTIIVQMFKSRGINDPNI